MDWSRLGALPRDLPHPRTRRTTAAAIAGIAAFAIIVSTVVSASVVFFSTLRRLQLLQGGYFVDYSVVLAGVLLATLPLIILFAFTGKHLVTGIMQGAVKG